MRVSLPTKDLTVVRMVLLTTQERTQKNVEGSGFLGLWVWFSDKALVYIVPRPIYTQVYNTTEKVAFKTVHT